MIEIDSALNVFSSTCILMNSLMNQTRLNSSDLNRPSINLHGSDEEGQENRSNFFVRKVKTGSFWAVERPNPP